MYDVGTDTDELWVDACCLFICTLDKVLIAFVSKIQIHLTM
jgi:hypothetical protein